jgi:hypothetical protein
VGASAVEPGPEEKTKGGSVLTAALSAAVLAGLVLVGFAFWGSHTSAPAIPVVATPVSPPQVYYAPAPVYTPPLVQQPVIQQPVQVVPAQPRFIFVNPADRSGGPQGERERSDARGFNHERGR